MKSATPPHSHTSPAAQPSAGGSPRNTRWTAHTSKDTRGVLTPPENNFERGIGSTVAGPSSMNLVHIKGKETQ